MFKFIYALFNFIYLSTFKKGGAKWIQITFKKGGAKWIHSFSWLICIIHR
jgi:hypothetical protein